MSRNLRFLVPSGHPADVCRFARYYAPCGLLLAGHSTKSAARELAISDGTVKVHRKHIYQRLAVSSQTQLFRLFLDHVALVSRQRGG